ncbi:MAG: hypothetical protein IJ347_04565 [Faecalibacterium sp.]|nr:hypothetical protein [Faecalibacterium sp.]
MELFLNLAGTAVMVVFLVLLVWRGLWQLGWLPAALHCPFAVKPLPRQAQQPFDRRLCLFWFCAALAVQWAAALFGAWRTGHLADFGPWFWHRFTTAGDAPHYLRIAQEGYATEGEWVNLIVFYPLYPTLIELVARLTGLAAKQWGRALAALLISQLCWGFAAVRLRILAGRLCGNDICAARCASAAMLLFPFSFFSLGVYTESLFLLLTLGCLDALACGRFDRAGLWGFLAALCRTQGVLLVLAAGYAWFAAGKKSVRSFVPLLAIPAGFGVYLWLNWMTCGSPNAYYYFQTQPPWYQSVHWVGTNLAQNWSMAVAHPGLARFIYWPQIVLYFAAMALLLYGVLHGAPVWLLIYGGGYIGFSYLSGWLISGSRYVFGCAALYPVVGCIKNKAARYAVLAAETIFLLLYSVYYMQGQAIM